MSASAAHWYLDAPVSNSGKLKTRLLGQAQHHGWDWQVTLAPNPDKVIAEAPEIAVTSDSWIITRAERWANVTHYIVEQCRNACQTLSLA